MWKDDRSGKSEEAKGKAKVWIWRRWWTKRSEEKRVGGASRHCEVIIPDSRLEGTRLRTRSWELLRGGQCALMTLFVSGTTFVAIHLKCHHLYKMERNKESQNKIFSKAFSYSESGSGSINGVAPKGSIFASNILLMIELPAMEAASPALRPGQRKNI